MTDNSILSAPSLPPTYVSYEKNYGELQSYLSRNPVWNTSIPNGVGSTLLSILATMQTSMNYFSSRRVQENYIDTAQSPFSIYSSAFTNTGTLYGNNPSISQIQYIRNDLSSTEKIIIPAYSNWDLVGTNFFNPVAIDLTEANSTGYFFLTEGVPETSTFTSTGLANQIFNVSSNFSGSPDVIVTATDPLSSNVSIWKKADSLLNDGIYYYTNDIGELVSAPSLVYESCVYIDGTVRVKFGDGFFGQIPAANSIITVVCYNCSGGSYNNTAVGQSFFNAKLLSDFLVNDKPITSYVTSFTTQNVVDGTPPPSYFFYKATSSNIAASRNFLSSPQDFESNLLSYSYGDNGNRPIVGCKILTGKDLANKNNFLANTVVPILLMDSTLYGSLDFKNSLATYISENSLMCVVNPILANIIPFELTVSVVMSSSSLTSTQVSSNIIQAISNLICVYSDSKDSFNVPVWNISSGNSSLLGKTYYLSDFYNSVLPVVGDNKIVISYNYKGSSDVFKLEPYECLGLNFNEKPVKINIIN